MKRKQPSAPKTTHTLGRPKDAAKRESIVNAATTLFMKDGYEMTSMEAVAKKADVSKLTIYSHFKNKDELFKAVINQRCDKQAMPECFLDKSKMPVEKALFDIGHRMVGLIFSPDSLRLQRIMHTEAIHHPQVVKIFYEAGPKRVRASFGALLAEFDKQGQLSVPDTAKATEQFFSLLKGELLSRIMLHQATRPDEKDLKNHVQATVDFFLAAYRPKKRN